MPKLITKELFLALEAAHGQGRILVVVAGEGCDRVEFAARKIDAKEWGVFLAFQRNKNEGAADAMLRRAVVGISADATVSEREALKVELEADPQLGDFWGMQLLQAAGWQAPLAIEPPAETGDPYVLTASVEHECYSVEAKRLNGPRWQEVRRAVAKEGDAPAEMLAFRLATGREPEDFGLRPALPYVFGAACMGLGTKAGAGPKSFSG